MWALLSNGIMLAATVAIGAHGGFWVSNREAAVMDRQQGGRDVTEQGGSSAMEATRVVSQVAALTSWQHGGSISAAHGGDNRSTGMGGASVQLWGSNRGWKPLEHFLRAVDEVSAKDIASIAQKLISSPLTMASHGDGSNLFHKFCD
ncbi:hypothetical protein RHMOL_Rhmol05G0035400 [Rhododendron molle]|uniref:Uncharacterized protein n=1 Tax=Rhododendron molle TaxID=49168 RepID=A0ACC0NKD6_RHOML|nr:hypothetical protein RHMOL_Rhmol05G0035400 [Rhododendron molle]